MLKDDCKTGKVLICCLWVWEKAPRSEALIQIKVSQVRLFSFQTIVMLLYGDVIGYDALRVAAIQTSF